MGTNEIGEKMKKGKLVKKVSKRENGTVRIQHDVSKPVITDQSDANSADINVIMANYAKTGVLPATREALAQYVDNTQVVSLEEAHALIKDAQDMFMQLPAEIRKLMDNDPAKMEQFIADPKNKDILVKNGIIEEALGGGSAGGESASPKQQTSEASKSAEGAKES